jgi:sugar/nucleoside kinase (ribokinase family)
VQPELICIGEPLVELNQTTPGEPSYLMGHGGDTSNCAVAAARQGTSVGYLTALGQDSFGDSFVQLWAREGVDYGHVLRLGGASTGIYFVSHGPTGHEFSYLRRDSAASRLSPRDIPEDAIARAKVLHASGISQAISASACDAVFRAIEIAKGGGTLVSYDTNLRLRLWPLPRARAIIHATAGMADILLPGLDDGRALTGLEEPDRRLLSPPGPRDRRPDARLTGRAGGHARAPRADRSASGRGGRCHRRRRCVRRRVPRRVSALGRSLRRGALRQRRRRARGQRLRRGGAAAGPGGGRAPARWRE